MSAPRECDWVLLKKMGRYLIHRLRLVIEFMWQKRSACLDGYTDSDWGGCTRSRKSTSVAVIMVGKHMIKGYSKQQKVLALSSAEAETYGMVACSAEVLGIQSCARDLGLEYTGTIYADASAALGIVMRRGIGKVRHIRTQSLWLQEAHATKRLGFEKIDGSRNPSDLMTKHLSDTLQQRHLEYIGTRAAGGRAESAPELNSVEKENDDRYLLGTVPAAFTSILKDTYTMNVEGEERESGERTRWTNEQRRGPAGQMSSACDRQLLLPPAAPIVYSSSTGCRRNKCVRFSPLVALHKVIAYSEVYGVHPRTFEFDAHGNRIVGMTTPAVAARERNNLIVSSAKTVEPIYSVVALPRDGDRSREEECRSESSRSGREKRVTDYADNTSQGAKARQSARDVRTFSAGLAQATRARRFPRARSIS